MTKKQVILTCGANKYELKIPEGACVQIAEPKKVQKAEYVKRMIREALDSPIGSLPIENIIKPGQKICIITDDITRLTPVKEILSELLSRLGNAGIAKEDIIIVIALGSHRKMTCEEMIKKVGDEVYASYKVVNSEFLDQSKLVEVGKSQMGTPIRVLKDAMEADIRIGIGNIVPHGCMGWSGGAKILYPGITSEEIVSEFHVMQGLADDILFGSENCHIRLAVEKWTEQIGLHFIINTVLTEDLELYRVVAGHYVKAHRAGVVYGKEVFGAVINGRPDIVVVSSYPLYADFWQCTKALYGSGNVIAKGGTILLISPCTEGIGPHKNVCGYIQLTDDKEVLIRKIKNGETGEELLTMAVGVSMGKINKYCRIAIISDGVTKEEVAEGGYDWYSEKDLQKAFDEAMKRYDNPKVLIIPIGGDTVPLLAE